MQTLDINGNDYPTALYESYLSKAIIDFRSGYALLFRKIAIAIQTVLDYNQDDFFKRHLFSAFSVLSQEFPGHTQIELFTQENFNLFASTGFHKIFFESLARYAKFPSREDPTPSTFASQIRSKISNQSSLLLLLRQHLDSNNIFNDKKNGRQEIESDEPFLKTQKLGITSEDKAPLDLKKYFNNFFIPAQNQFERDNNSKAYQWLKEHNLPFIAGISGTVGTCYCGLIQLMDLSQAEIRNYLMTLTATLVARGHHSFGETHPVLEKIGFNIKNISNKREYYEQFLTPEFKASKEYQNFLASSHTYLEDAPSIKS
jgi:hypothetical protein